jgi:hypothetical protein
MSGHHSESIPGPVGRGQFPSFEPQTTDNLFSCQSPFRRPVAIGPETTPVRTPGSVPPAAPRNADGSWSSTGANVGRALGRHVQIRNAICRDAPDPVVWPFREAAWVWRLHRSLRRPAFRWRARHDSDRIPRHEPGTGTARESWPPVPCARRRHARRHVCGQRLRSNQRGASRRPGGFARCPSEPFFARHGEHTGAVRSARHLGTAGRTGGAIRIRCAIRVCCAIRVRLV